ncbi:MAG: transcriptional regulator with XRE-family HTH domain [Planctomycetota bacterium]|jgi:transcriptional regulator with XRE-family HTH domain
MTQPDLTPRSHPTVPRNDDASLVATCRVQAGLTREQLSARLGVPEHLVSLWETPGYEGVDLPLLRRVAAATGCDLEIRFARPKPRGLAAIAARSTAAALALMMFAALPGCITETESSLRRPTAGAMRTQGVIITGDIDEIWTEVQRTVAGMTNQPLLSRGVARSFATQVNGEDLDVLVEAYDATRTIVHVNSTNPDIADFIRQRVTLR